MRRIFSFFLLLLLNLLYSLISSTPYILYQLPSTDDIHSGHTKSCFSYAIISYESCLQVFMKYDTCTYLKYENKICSLHNHQKSNFQHVPSSQPPSSSSPFLDPSSKKDPLFIDSGRIIMTKLTTIPSSIPINIISALRKYRRCVAIDRENVSPHVDPVFHSLPKLAIVISVTSEWVEAHESGVKSLTSNFECYARVHNYSFHLNILPNMPPSKFYYQRHRSILHNYLPHFQHVLHLDADSLILNHSRSLDPYLSHPHVDIHLHLHENGEITAAMYLIRNSRFSRCFLDYWSNFSPSHVDVSNDLHSLETIDLTNQITGSSQYSYFNTYEVPNYDNGDLVSAVFNLLYPKKYSECIAMITKFNQSQWDTLTNPYHQTIVECWKTTHSSLYRYLRRNIIPKTGIMIYYPHEGFWRTKGKMNRFGNWWDNLFGKCFPSFDLIGHGWKAMARTLWPLPSQELPSGDLTEHFTTHINITKLYLDETKESISSIMMQSTCNIKMIKAGYGANSRCQWMTLDEELHLSQKYCLWRSKICDKTQQIVDNNSPSYHYCDGNETKLCYSRCVLEEPSTCLHRKVKKVDPEANLSHRFLASRTKDSRSDKKSQEDRKERISSHDEFFERQAAGKFGVEHEEWWMGQLCAACPL